VGRGLDLAPGFAFDVPDTKDSALALVEGFVNHLMDLARPLASVPLITLFARAALIANFINLVSVPIGLYSLTAMIYH
jgi:hypothetical protein